MQLNLLFYAFGLGMIIFIVGQLPGIMGTTSGNNFSAIGGSIMSATMIISVILLFYKASNL